MILEWIKLDLILLDYLFRLLAAMKKYRHSLPFRLIEKENQYKEWCHCQHLLMVSDLHSLAQYRMQGIEH